MTTTWPEAITTRINRILDINHLTLRKTKTITGKSTTYIHERRAGHKEWTPSDIDAIAQATGYQPDEITAQHFTLKPSIDYIKAKENA